MTAPAISTPQHIEHRIKTADGRTLAVAEWGDPNGVPEIAMHGTPGGRITYWEDPTIYARHGLRRITYDRPGYGESTRFKGRSVADVVIDVEAITAALGIDRFVVTGGSGGGPHCLATAALMPDRVIRCLAEVSIAPYPTEGLDWLAGMTEGNVEEFNAAMEGEEQHRRVAERERKTTLDRLAQGRADFLGDSYELSDADKAQFAKHLNRVADQFFNAWRPASTAGSTTCSRSSSRGVSRLRRSGSRRPSNSAERTISCPRHTATGWRRTSQTRSSARVRNRATPGSDADVELVTAWLAGEVSDLSRSA